MATLAGIQIDRSVRSTMYDLANNRKVKRVVWHHWGSRGQKHDNVVSYLSKRRKPGTSAHFVVSAGRISEIVSPKNIAWHARGGNSDSIGVEARPEMSDADFETGAQLLAYIRRIYGNIPVVGHRDVLATECPGEWYKNLKRLSDRANAINGGAASKPVSKPSSSLWDTNNTIKNMSSAKVKELQSNLVKLGFSVGSSGVDGSYKANTVAAVKAFQKANNLSVDGIAGPATSAKITSLIAAKNKPAPVKKPAANKSNAPAFPLPKGFVYGPSTGPKEQVSGRTYNSAVPYDVNKDANGEYRSIGLYAWQKQMKSRGWNIDVDGRFGPQTEKIALQFKKNKKGWNDPLIGPETWKLAWDLPVT